MRIGYKIEIVLFAVAVLLIGSIFVISKTDTKQPKSFVFSTQAQTTTKETFKVKININTANFEELMELDGVGESTAKKIIEYRNSKSFKTTKDIMNVSGIGEKKFEAIKDYITVK